MSDLSGKTAVVVGATRGFGLGVTTALAAAGAQVIGVARDTTPLPEAAAVHAEAGDATDPALAAAVLRRHDPELLVLVAGATPPMAPVHEQTWDDLSTNWDTDVRITFEWLRRALTAPLRPGSRVIVFSSGAALRGSPLSGGYAGAKAAQRFLAEYAHGEAARLGLGITITSLLPGLTPTTDVGRAGATAYAERAGIGLDEFTRRMGALLTADSVGAAVVELLLTDADTVERAYVLAPDGLRPVPA